MKRTGFKQKPRKPLKRTKLASKACKPRKVTQASKLRRKRGEWSSKTADTYFSLWIRERDKKCRCCGTKDNLTCSHYHCRGQSSVRYDPLNCVALCQSCHSKWEGPKAEYSLMMMKWLGESEFLALTLRAGLTMKRTEAIKKFKEWYE